MKRKRSLRLNKDKNSGININLNNLHFAIQKYNNHMRISGKTKICLVLGDPIEQSLSPLMHNKAYEALGIDDKFVYLGAKVKIKDIKKAIDGVRAMGIKGLACTMPHKVKVMKYLDQIDEEAKEIGAVNTVVNENGVLRGYNTDWLGALIPLKKRISLKGKKVGVIGAGGVARAIIYGLIKEIAHVKIFNIDTKEAKPLAEKYGCSLSDFKSLPELKNFDVIINCTPLGMQPYKNKSPVPASVFHKGQIVMDVVYNPYETKMLKQAKRKGARIVRGYEMFLNQGIVQFAYHTGRKAPEKVMEKAIIKILKK